MPPATLCDNMEILTVAKADTIRDINFLKEDLDARIEQAVIDGLSCGDDLDVEFVTADTESHVVRETVREMYEEGEIKGDYHLIRFELTLGKVEIISRD